MNKPLLTTLTLLALGASAMSASAASFEFRYCGAQALLIPSAEGTEVSAAMYIPAEVAARYAGDAVSAVSVFTAYNEETFTNIIPTAKVWLTYDLDSEPFAVAEGALSPEMLTYTAISLPEAYTIEADKPFYVGYTVVSPSEMQSTTVWDQNLHDNDWGAWLKTGDGPWTNMASQYGFVLIKATIEGDNIVTSAAGIYSSEATQFVYPGENVEGDLIFINEGAEDINSVEVEVTVGDTAPVKEKFFTDYSVDYNGIYRIRPTAPVNVTGNNIPVTMKITKVNDEANKAKEPAVTHYVMSMPKGEGFSRNVVMEQETSLYVEVAPRGIAANELLGQEHGTTGEFIPVMVHLSDELSAQGYDAFFNEGLCTSIPAFIPDRLISYRNTPASYEEMSRVLQEVTAIPAFAKVEADVYADPDDEEMLYVKTSSTFAGDCEGDWRLAFILRRDHMGPYAQANGFSGSDQEVGGFEIEPNPADIYLDNIAVMIDSFNGIRGSVPATVKEGESYEYVYDLHLDDPARNRYNTVVVCLINALNGAIENAVAVPYAEFHQTSASTIEASAAGATGSRGAIILTGDFERAEIYTAAGARTAAASAAGTLPAAPGLYIVSIDGKAAKVIVR